MCKHKKGEIIMKKSELVAAIAERTGYTKKEVIENLLPALEKVLTVDIPP